MRKIYYECTCDKCGKVWRVDNLGDAAMGISTRLVNGIEYDFCESCRDEYDKFMREVEERWFNA